MFLRKLVVMVVPLALCALACMVLPWLGGLGFWSNVLKGVLLGVVLALLLPLSGASKRKEPFAVLLWVPMVLLTGIVAYQYIASAGIATVPVLQLFATTNGQVVLTESAFVGFMATQAVRTRR